MKAVILAAGRGKRMMPLTSEIPKPMIIVDTKPLLYYTLDAVHNYVDEIIIVIGYHGDQIKAYFGKAFNGTPITYKEQEAPLGTGHALLTANPEGRFIMINGDDFFDKEIIMKVLDHDLCVAAAHVDNPKKFGIFEVKDNLVVGLEEKPEHPKSDLANIGLWVMDERLVHLMENIPKSPRGEFEITDALKEFIKSEKVYCEVTDKWIPVGYPEDIEKVEKYLKGGLHE